MENWNPLEIDYNDSKFNTYEEGIVRISNYGDKAININKDSNEIKLYVSNIPLNITQRALTNLFKRVGFVKSADIVKSTEKKTNFGFVNFIKSDEASEAISRYNNFEFSNGNKLRVQLSMTREERDAKYNDNKYNKRDDEINNDMDEVYGKNDDQNQIVPNSTKKIDKSVLVTREELDSYQIAPVPAMQKSPNEEYSKNFCIVCKSIGDNVCKICKNEWYCSTKCQQLAWPKHQLYCKLLTKETEEMEEKFDFYFDDMIDDIENYFIDDKFFTKQNLQIDIIPTNTKVIVTHVLNESEFYVNKASMQFERNILKYQMNEFYMSYVAKKDFHPDIDEICACHITKENFDVKLYGWRRVLIKERLENDKYIVFDIDIGLTYEVDKKILNKMNIQSMKIPSQAVLCSLFKNKSKVPLKAFNSYMLSYAVGVKVVILDDVK